MKKPKSDEGCIYHVVNKKNDKGYIGQHSTPKPELRWTAHLRLAIAAKLKSPFYAALRKYGCKGFYWNVIWRGPVSELNEKEIYYIKKLHTLVGKGGGYNLTTGGERTTYSTVSKRRLSRAALKRWEDDAYRAEMSRMGLERASDPMFISADRKARNAFWSSRTQKEREEIGRAVSRGHANRDSKDRARTNELSRKGAIQQWKTPGFRAKRAMAVEITWSKKSVIELSIIAEKHRVKSVEMWAKRTPKERKAIGAAISATYAKKTSKELKAYSEARRIGALKRYADTTPEERSAQWHATHQIRKKKL